MKKEDVEKVVTKCAAQLDAINANSYINSVWHDMDTMPDFSQLPILMEHKSGSIHFIDDRLSVWTYLKKYYVRWAYVRDLMPD